MTKLGMLLAGLALAGTMATAWAASAWAAETRVLTQEPGPGHLRSGETVLVDDGSCPKNQIKQVVGGSDQSLGSGTRRSGVPRQVSCVAR